MEASTQFQKKAREDRQCGSERAALEAVRAKVKVQWRLRKLEMPGTWKIC